MKTNNVFKLFLIFLKIDNIQDPDPNWAQIRDKCNIISQQHFLVEQDLDLVMRISNIVGQLIMTSQKLFCLT